MSVEFLKALFSDKALTFDEFAKAVADSKDIKLANLADGKYVDKQKLDDKAGELETANKTIADLQDAVKKFDGVDVEALNRQIGELKEKYDKDTSALKLNSALDMALVSAKAKNPKLAKAALDLSLIKLDGDKLLGFDEQIAKIKESDGYLFDDVSANQDQKHEEKSYAGRVNGSAGHNSFGGNEETEKMSDEEYYNKFYAKKE